MKGKGGESDCLNLLAIVFIRLADYNSAAKYAKLCYAIDEKSGDPTKIILRDRSTQLIVLAWILSFLVIIYL